MMEALMIHVALPDPSFHFEEPHCLKPITLVEWVKKGEL